MEYAGFWRRGLGYISDGAILTLFFAALLAILYIMSSGLAFISDSYIFNTDITDTENIRIFLQLLSWVIMFLYFAILDSSEEQGTYGKRINGTKVTDLSGNRISFKRALGRSLAMFLSFLTLGVGFLMAGFTKKKQCLHDIVAGCLVISK